MILDKIDYALFGVAILLSSSGCSGLVGATATTFTTVYIWDENMYINNNYFTNNEILDPV